MNLMISCVGRQVFLVEAFQRALGGSGSVVASDVDPHAAGLRAADVGLISPPFGSKEYDGWVIDTVRDQEIRLLMSLVMDDLQRLEALRAGLSDTGCRLVGADTGTLQTCKDKLSAASFFADNGFLHPPTRTFRDVVDDPSLPFPQMAKRRFGRGGRDQLVIPDQKSLTDFLEYCRKTGSHEDYIFQDRVEGVEYGLDVVNDLGGQYRATLARRKFAMRNGETDVAITVDNEEIEGLGKALGGALRHEGLVDVDLIKSEQGLYVLDVNIRFGGGYIFSHLAGADVPAALVAWARGETENPGSLRAQARILGARYNRVLRLSGGGNE